MAHIRQSTPDSYLGFHGQERAGGGPAALSPRGLAPPPTPLPAMVSGFMFLGSGFRVQGSGLGLGFRVQGLGVRVQG